MIRPNVIKRIAYNSKIGMKNKFSEESIDFIKDHLNDDPTELMLEAHKYAGLPMKEIVTQIASRQKAKSKSPEWFSKEQIIFPPKQNLEQASSELTALFKARFVEGGSLVDATGGTGIDTYYLSKNFSKTFYVEPNSELCELAEHNFEVLNADIEIQNGKAEDYLSSGSETFDWIFIDPSRRDDASNRVYALEDCIPNVVEIKTELLNSAHNVLIKCSPMLDIKNTLKQFKECFKVQIVAVDNDVKELLLYLRSGFKDETSIEAWNISKNRKEEVFEFRISDEQQAAAEIGEPKKFIYEPNSALMKSGAYNLIAQRFMFQKLHSNTHLYTSDNIVKDFPGKTLQIKEVFKPSKKEIRKRIKDGKVNVIVRNYPMGANQIKKKFSLKDGGEAFLIFCEIEEERFKAIWCEKG